MNWLQENAQRSYIDRFGLTVVEEGKPVLASQVASLLAPQNIAGLFLFMMRVCNFSPAFSTHGNIKPHCSA